MIEYSGFIFGIKCEKLIINSNSYLPNNKKSKVL